MSRSLIAFFVLASLFGAARAAGEQRIAKGTAVEKFSAEDLALMRTAVRRALDDGAERETRTWKNDKTGASGTVTPLDRHTWQGLSCRRAELVNTRGTTTGKGVYRFCEKSAGTWKIVGPLRGGS